MQKSASIQPRTSRLSSRWLGADGSSRLATARRLLGAATTCRGTLQAVSAEARSKPLEHENGEHYRRINARTRECSTSKPCTSQPACNLNFLNDQKSLINELRGARSRLYPDSNLLLQLVPPTPAPTSWFLRGEK